MQLVNLSWAEPTSTQLGAKALPGTPALSQLHLSTEPLFMPFFKWGVMFS